MTCDHCGRVSETPTCDACLGYQAWASGTGPGTKGDKRRLRKLDRARSDLGVLPELCAGLPDCLTDRSTNAEGGGSPGKISGSPALIRLDVLALIDDRQKAGWWGEDPRYQSVVGRYGVGPTLETWTRVVREEMPEHEWPAMADSATVNSECRFLLEAWDWVVEQQWAEDLAADVAKLTNQLRTARGERRPERYACPTCGNRARLVVGGYLACDEDHLTSVRDLEGQQRRRPPMTTREVVEEFPITEAQLWQWKKRRRIKPIDSSEKPMRWLPWDVFCLLNPDIAEAIDTRDRAELQR